MQFDTTSVLPDASRRKIAARSSSGVLPSRCADTEFYELLGDVDAVADAAGKGQRPAALAVLEPMGDNVADQFRPVHAIGELGLDIVAGLRSHATQVRVDRRIYLCCDQITDAALVGHGDQVGNLRALDHDAEDAAESATIATTWRCGQAEHDRVGVCLEHRPIGHRAGVVGLIDDEQVGERHWHRCRADRPRVQRLD
jgi:hypothetical protein